jgi:cytochrome c oxidase cbb3-type subunit 2
MKMTPAFLIVASLMVFWASVFVAVFLPAMTMTENPSEIWRPWTQAEADGHRLYVANGCSYCHSLYVRTIDQGSGRIAQRGDYAGQRPAILGTERTGPDLSQEGGEHPDDWHLAHFYNPRYTRPMSLMPSMEFLGPRDVEKLTAYVQSLGGKDADFRVDRQKQWKSPAVRALRAGRDENILWLHDRVPDVWRRMPNPYPPTPAELELGKVVYQQFCTGCHGPMGDGQGPAAAYLDPPPLNFTTLRGHLVEGKYIGGLFYYQVMNGITGTAMPYFRKDLESAKIWAVSNYLATQFVGYSDSTIEPRGIPAADEPQWRNTSKPPATQPAAKGGAP